MNSSDERGILRDIVAEIESLRMQRRSTYAQIPHPLHKRFTQEELRDFMPSYKNWVLGLTQRLPSRAQLLQVADYLECTLVERNNLLLAAQYLPEWVELRDDLYQAILDQTQTLLYQLPFPALLVTRNWTAEAYNEQFQALTGCPPRLRAPGLLWMFDPQLPFRKLIEFDEKSWQQNVSGTIVRFQGYNHVFQREQWYRDQVERARALSNIAPQWDKIQAGDYANPAIEALVVRTPTVEKPLHLNRVRISLGGAAPYPLIHAYLPADAGTRFAFAASGIPATENRGEDVLRASFSQRIA